MASNLGMAVDLFMAYLRMLVSMTLTLMQGHSGGRQRQKFSVELFRQLSKQQALHLLQR